MGKACRIALPRRYLLILLPIPFSDTRSVFAIRRSLRKPQLIGDIDTLIAATAIERNLMVVTIDTDFQRVPQLKVILLSPTTLRVVSAP